ncbi:hypothetical protein [Actinomadura rupiterrae]|uniref:hypothetical protein n=1 Tax=Actinomadura rupiterrae TaxID=559627 RepID=UPI0020A276B2|nr:hypothetical protein [Actinomadura rupiterrae]MCP2335296.1 MFS family permease [Actinomadura rupiterrae]
MSGAGGGGRLVPRGVEVPFRPMSISEMLDCAIAGIRYRPRTVLGLSVAISTVVQVLGSVLAYYFIGQQARGEVTPRVLIRSVGAQATLGAIDMVLTAFGILVLAGILAPVLARTMFGLDISLGQAWQDARPRFWRLLLMAFVVLVVSLAALAVPLLPFSLALAGGAHPALGVLSALFGIPVGLLLMVWVYVMLVQSLPALVLERQGIGGALTRARRLSKGRWWRTFGTLLLAMLVTVFMGFFALRIPFLIAQLVLFGGSGSGSDQLLPALALDTVGRIVSWSIVLPFDAGVIALLYMDRRMRREGLDLDLATRPTPESDDGFFDLWRPTATPSRPVFVPPLAPNAPPVGPAPGTPYRQGAP